MTFIPTRAPGMPSAPARASGGPSAPARASGATPAIAPATGPALGLVLGLAFGSIPAGADAADDGHEAGRTIFTETAQPQCAICHALADAGAKGEIGPDLDEMKPTADQVRAAVTSGIGVMPAFADSLSAEEIETVSAYVADVAGSGG